MPLRAALQQGITNCGGRVGDVVGGGVGDVVGRIQYVPLPNMLIRPISCNIRRRPAFYTLSTNEPRAIQMSVNTTI